MKSSGHALIRSTLFAVLVAFAASALPATARSQDANPFESLTEEQTAFAERTLAFLSHMESMYFDRIEELNGGLALETLDHPTDISYYNAKATRGPVIEKGGRMRSARKKSTGSGQDERPFSRFFSIDVHPKTPLVGMLHAAFVLHFNADGTSSVGGWLDVLPAAMSEEDLAYLKGVMDEVYEKYGVDGEPHRKLSCQGSDREDVGGYRRRPACVGGSFYGRNMMSVTEENFQFMTEAYERFLNAFLTLVEKNKNTPYTAEDLAAQDAMRRNWLEDRLFSDPYTTSVTPYEIWSLSTLPPVVKF